MAAEMMQPHKHMSGLEGPPANVCWWGVYTNPKEQADVGPTQKKIHNRCKPNPSWVWKKMLCVLSCQYQIHTKHTRSAKG